MAAFPESYPPSYPDQSPSRLIGAPMPGTLAAPDRLTLQQQANALIYDIERADNILGRLSPVPTNDGVNNPELPLGHALQVARERMRQFIERLDGLAMHVGQT